MIDTPMDLGTVREELQCEHYNTPAEFARDVRLVFSNSKAYNTNKKSRVCFYCVQLSFKEINHRLCSL